jgi:hypothetical protein
MDKQKERHEQSQQRRSDTQPPEGGSQIEQPIFVTDDSHVRFAVETLKKVIKIQFGPEFEGKWKQVQEESKFDDPRILLALKGDLITPECLVAELEMNERLDDAIDRSFSRLRKFQADRYSRSAISSTSPLLQHRKLHRKR